VLGAQGPAGPAGTILSGKVPPGIGVGGGGDYFIDTATHFLYGPTVRQCPPYPCRTSWGKGISLVGPTGPTSTSPADGTAHQVTGFANMPSGDSPPGGRPTCLSTAGYYSVTAIVTLVAATWISVPPRTVLLSPVGSDGPPRVAKLKELRR
jgi:hypothetical protein